MTITLFSAALLFARVLTANAESHTVRFVNNCGFGTPTLVQGGKILSTGQDYTSNGPFESAIAYLQTGKCLLNGEHCTLLEMNMNNPSCPGCGSSADISLIPSHAFSVSSAFSYFGGDGSCDGLGAVCADPNCNTAFFGPDDNQVQRACQADNANLLITFCGPKGTGFTPAVVGSLSSSKPEPAPPASPASQPAAVPTPSPLPAVPGPASPPKPAQPSNKPAPAPVDPPSVGSAPSGGKPAPPASATASAGNTPPAVSSPSLPPTPPVPTSQPQHKTCKRRRSLTGARAHAMARVRSQVFHS